MLNILTKKEKHFPKEFMLAKLTEVENNEIGEAIACTDERRGEYMVVVGKLGRPRLRREDNIKMDLQEVELGYGLD